MSDATVYFADASALVKLYVDEAGSARVEAILAGAAAPDVAIASLTPVEITSALVRRTRKGDIEPSDLEEVLRRLDVDVARRYRVIEMGGGTLARASDLVRRHALRAADAIQLACALFAAGEFGLEGRAVLCTGSA